LNAIDAKEVTMKILRLRSWNFQAPNLEAMTRFYHTALGADLRAEQTLAGIKVHRLRAGETGLGLFDASENSFPAYRITLSTSKGRMTQRNWSKSSRPKA
jgi:predicted enzyme related to lactoylglutathione lyase